MRAQSYWPPLAMWLQRKGCSERARQRQERMLFAIAMLGLALVVASFYF